MLAVPVSLVLGLLYINEDRIIHHLVMYIAHLSRAEQELARGTTQIPNLEASREIDSFTRTTVFLRFFAQVFTFVVIPALAVTYRHLTNADWPLSFWGEATFSWLCLSSLLGALIWAMYMRKAATQEDARPQHREPKSQFGKPKPVDNAPPASTPTQAD